MNLELQGFNKKQEESPDAGNIFKEEGVTLADIQKFRKKTKPDIMSAAVTAIAKRVMACHGIAQ